MSNNKLGSYITKLMSTIVDKEQEEFVKNLAISELTNLKDSLEEFILFPYSVTSIKKMNEAGFLVIIITNQAGIARGLFDEDCLNAIHDKLLQLCQAGGAKIDAIYYCPYHPDKDQCKLLKYNKDSEDRKPKPGMIKKALKEFDIDLAKSYLVGDSWGDIVAGQAMGLTTMGVRTGNAVVNEKGVAPDIMVENLAEAVAWIVEKEKRESD